MKKLLMVFFLSSATCAFCMQETSSSANQCSKTKEEYSSVIMRSNEQLFQAVRSLDAHKVNELIRVGINVNIHNEEHETPLHLICNPHLDSLDVDKIASRYQIALALLKARADVNSKDRGGRTPIYSLATANYSGAPLSLASSPAESTKWDKKIFIQSRKTLMTFLLMHGLDINMRDESGKTVLDYTKEQSPANYNYQNNPILADCLKKWAPFALKKAPDVSATPGE